MLRLVIVLLTLLGNLSVCPGAGVSAEIVTTQDKSDTHTTLEVDWSAQNSTLLSVPLDLGSMDIGRWLENKGLSPLGIHGWNAQTQSYVRLKTLRPGEGFLLAKGPGKVSINGVKIVVNAVDFPLEKGWNLIGVPYETGIPLATLRIKLNNVIKAYRPAAENKWVGGVNTLIDGQMMPVADDSATLEPWRGYWLYAYQPCILQIPAVKSADKNTKGNKPAVKR